MARPAWTAQCTNRKLIGELLPVRRRESHKGDYGRVLLLCGSEGLTGAARLAAKAALRTGSGLVYLGVPEKIYPIIAAGAGSEIVFPLPCDEAGRLCMAALPAITARLPEMDAVLLGPGLGRSEELTRLVQAVLSVCRAPLVLDADGINAVAAHIDVLRGCACPVVLTPHDGEFLRLGGDPRAADRTQEAMRLADRTHAVLLLKGSRTVITDGFSVYVNHTGNPGLAAGGSGDVLAGMLVSLLGQHIMPLEAAATAAWLHGSAADLAAQELGEYGMVPEDLLLCIPRLLPAGGDLLRKKLALRLCTGPMLLSAGSAKRPAQPPLTFRTALLQSGGCSFTAAITADYGESAASFTLDCVFSPETGASVTVTEPESIAGIQAQVKDTAASVSYDGMQLGLGSLANGNLAPLAAPYVLGQCWAGEYIDSTGTEDGLLRTTYRMGYEEKELVVDTWFSQEPLTPVRAELSFEGRMVLRADISAFSMKSTEE